MSARGDAFVKAWTAGNLQEGPAYGRAEVARLFALLVADAAAAGIGLNELIETVGDPEDYLDGAALDVDPRRP